MDNEDRATTLASLDLLHAVLDADGDRVEQLVDEHGAGHVIVGLSRIAVALGQHQYGNLDEFRAFLHRWAIDLQLADLGAVSAGGEG